MGLLVVDGTIDIAQFWPKGSSDADTTKVHVVVTGNAFRFQAKAVGPFKVTRAFDGAKVYGKGKVSEPVKTLKKTGERIITVRLQGIDAPELHYRPTLIASAKQEFSKAQRERFKKFNEEYRQHYGETAAFMLGQFLERAQKNPLPCRILTRVVKPNDVFDVYGRFVGDVVVRIGGQDVNINRWVVEQGLAVPGLYDSMRNDEIRSLVNAARRASVIPDRPLSNMQTRIGTLNLGMVYRRPKKGVTITFGAGSDRGPVLVPKLFRRLALWTARTKARIPTPAFKPFLKGGTFYDTAAFLKSGKRAKQYELSEAVSAAGTILIRPEAMVIHEEESTLKRNGKAVTSW